MRRLDLIRAISNISGCSQRMTARIMDAYPEAVAEILTENRDEFVQFGDLGRFKVKHVKARDGITNLHDAKIWTKPAYDKLIFKLGTYGATLFDEDEDSEDWEDADIEDWEGEDEAWQ